MISNRAIGLIAVATPFWFVIVYFAMSSLRPEYNHFTKAISELGSVDAPNKWAWNIGGYIITGLGIALLGIGLARQFRGAKNSRWVSLPLIASGLFMAMSGVFPGDFDNRSSITMILHTIWSIGSFMGFLIAGFATPALLRRLPGWRAYALPSLIIVILAIASGVLRSGNAPGLGQRIGFALVFGWVVLIGIGLVRNSHSTVNVG